MIASPLVTIIACGSGAHAQESSIQKGDVPSTEKPASDGNAVWWTGSMLSNSAATLPKGHILLEPYVVDRLARDTSSYGSFTYILYGLTDYLTVGATPSFGYSTQRGDRISSGVGFGDLSLRAQWRLRSPDPSSWKPAVAVAIVHSLPTGRFDRLGSYPGDGQGSGLAATTLSVYAQSTFSASSGRPMRIRLNASATPPASTVAHGVSVYGTPEGSSTRVRQVTSISLGTSAEYSLSRSWALAFDLFGVRNGGLRLTPFDAEGSHTRTVSAGTRLIAMAPGVEYSWTPNLGILLAARHVAGGPPGSSSWTPAVAFNAFL